MARSVQPADGVRVVSCVLVLGVRDDFVRYAIAAEAYVRIGVTFELELTRS